MPARVALVLLSLFALPLLAAEPPPTAAAVYNLSSLQALALEANRSLAAARDGVDAARAQVVTAGAYPNPETEWVFGHASPRIPGGASGNAQSLAITQRIDNPWQREARIAAASAAAGGSAANLRLAESSLLARLKSAFYDLLRRQDELAAAREDLTLTESIREKVRVRVEVGESPRFELIRADAELLNAQRIEQSALLRVTQAKVAIRSLVAERLPEDFAIEGDWSEPDALPPLAQLRERVLGQNPEIAALRAETERAEQQLKLERARRMPELSLRAVQERDPDLENNRVGFLVTIPIWDRRAGPVADATAQLSRSRNSLEHGQFTLSQALTGAYGQYDIARNQVKALEGGILREAESALKVAEVAYRLGERGILDFLDARRVFRQVRTDLTAARYDLELARIEIERLQATDSPNRD